MISKKEAGPGSIKLSQLNFTMSWGYSTRITEVVFFFRRTSRKLSWNNVFYTKSQE